MKIFTTIGMLCFLSTLPLAANEVGFLEDFSISPDRSRVLTQLIPGTEDYYYYHCLYHLNRGEYEKLNAYIGPWKTRIGQTARLNEIETRAALLSYDRNPQATLRYIQQKMNLGFHHQRVILGAKPDLPTGLDQKLISREKLLGDSLARWGYLENFEDSALEWLAGENLNSSRKRVLLQRITRPDYPNLVSMIYDDITDKAVPTTFGSFPIHHLLTLAQLQELGQKKPDLFTTQAFVNAWVVRLQPDADSNWRHDSTLALAYLERLWDFVKTLPPNQNSLKAHVLYHRLALERSKNIHDQARFLEYLKLPRQQHYMAPKLLDSEQSRLYPANLGMDFSQVTLLGPIGADEPLVRSFLAKFFENLESSAEFSPLVNDTYLKHLFAQTKIELGQGNVEQWASMLPIEYYRQLRERIDIDFDYTNSTRFKAGDQVSLGVHIKNVPSLLIKIYELNTPNYFKSNPKDVETDINLDGLVPNHQRTITMEDGPFRRVLKKLDFPELAKPGIYVVDLIGAGKSSRALIHKGKLRALPTMAPDGVLVSVIDDAGNKVPNATLWLGGAEYTPGKDGNIIVPFSNSPGRRPVVLVQGGFASLDFLEHPAENYHLTCAFHVDRETLLTQRLAQLLVRPGVYLNGRPMSVKLLEDVRLRITSTDLAGVSSSTEVPGFKLFEDRESTHEFRVPNRLASLQFAITARVANASQGKKQDLAASETFHVNQIDRTDRIEDLHLAKFGNDYVLEVLGRTGEVRVDRPIQVILKHEDFKEPVHVSLKTDALGRIRLGILNGISSVTVQGPEGTNHVWNLGADRHTYRQVIHARQGETISIPHMGTGNRVFTADYALMEMRGSGILANRIDSLSIREGVLEIQGLQPGDYELTLKQTRDKIRIRVVQGEKLEGFIVGKTRFLREESLKSSQIQDMEMTEKELVIRLKNPSKFTRVHLFADRYQSAISPYQQLSKVRDSELDGVLPGFSDSVFVVGRNIGDEYRYVLDRKGQKVFAGNMLTKPSLLLNPWAVRSTETGEQFAVGGEAFDRRSKGDASRPAEAPAPKVQAPVPHQDSAFANLDFLADSAAVQVNLIPEKDGTIRVPKQLLGPHARFHAVLVDPVSTTMRSIAAPEQPAKFLDLRLATGLDPSRKFSQQKQITVVGPNQEFILEDVGSGRMEVYDSLDKVFALYSTISKDQGLAQFSFIPKWKDLKPEEKRKLYSENACHELSFFVYKKDPVFFKEVVAAHLANKKDKTFLDLWLLGQPLDAQLDNWRYSRLNIPERILLSQMIAGERNKVQRHLSDMQVMIPVNQERLDWYFNSSLSLEDLSNADYFGMVKAKREISLEQQEELRKATSGRLGAFRDQGLADPQGLAANKPAGGAFGVGQKPAGKNQAQAEDGAAVNGMLKDAKKSESLARRAGDSKGKDMPLNKEMDDKLEQEKESLHFRARGVDKLRELYRKMDPTMEWAENNYRNLVIQAQTQDLVKVNRFWLDYANHDPAKPFLSRHFSEASGNFTEMMLALAILDLPFEAKKPVVKHEGHSLKMRLESHGIVLHEEVRPAEDAAAKVNILISQDFYRHGERFIEVQGEKQDKFVTGEFVKQTVYGCQVVVTNPTSSRQKLTVLLQLPVGAIALAGAQFTRSMALNLEPYRTQTIDYLFYFPAAGKYPHFPALVAKNEKFIASAIPFVFEVVEMPTKVDTASWEFVSQNGSPEEVIQFLNRENVRALDLTKIAWRMRNKHFFDQVITLLDSRKFYHPDLWSYSIMHADLSRIDQYLQHNSILLQECGGGIQSKPLNFTTVERHAYEHLEYKPLVNSRIHALGKRRQIVNDRFHAQYHQFLKQISYKAQLSNEELMELTYYLLLQDRVEEALGYFKKVDARKISTRIQHDYFRAWLEMSQENLEESLKISEKYSKYPVARWANAFGDIIAQVQEAQGKGTRVTDLENRDQKQAELAALEPALDFSLEGSKILLNWQNLKQVQIHYYLMDVELLFSRNPFVQQSGNQFALIVPNHSATISLDQVKGKLTLDIPAQLAKKNLLVEISSQGKSKSLPYYSNAMDVQWMENYGQLKVTSKATGKPLAKSYIKVYSRDQNGAVKFHKDGYSDLRGRFDYASVSTPEKVPLEKFSVLVLSEENGAIIRETKPPQQ